MREKVEAALDKIRPALRADGCDVEAAIERGEREDQNARGCVARAPPQLDKSERANAGRHGLQIPQVHTRVGYARPVGDLALTHRKLLVCSDS